MELRPLTAWRRRATVVVAAAVLSPMVIVGFAGSAQAAKSDACSGGGFSLVNLTTSKTIASGTVDTVIPATSLGGTFGVRGRYTQFDVRSSDFAVFNQAFTGAANASDITGGRFTPVYASKIADLRGLFLNSGISAQLSGDGLEISRTGTGVSMKIQANDCAQGGVFQMEPQRSDGTTTRVVHTLATSATPGLTPFFFDNPNFRARIGQFLGADCASPVTGPASKFCVKVAARVNIANGLSAKFVARDSSQVATRMPAPACNTATPLTPSVAHCGGVSMWDVASGGRLGFVTGEDSVEVANPPTVCTSHCQAQNQTKGRLVVLGFPFPVPAGSKLTPRS